MKTFFFYDTHGDEDNSLFGRMNPSHVPTYFRASRALLLGSGGYRLRTVCALSNPAQCRNSGHSCRATAV